MIKYIRKNCSKSEGSDPDFGFLICWVYSLRNARSSTKLGAVQRILFTKGIAGELGGCRDQSDCFVQRQRINPMRPQVRGYEWDFPPLGKRCISIRVKGFESGSVFVLGSFFQCDRQLVDVLACCFQTVFVVSLGDRNIRSVDIFQLQ
jgi:hypothetical protein